jgi:hypothetical protein
MMRFTKNTFGFPLGKEADDFAKYGDDHVDLKEVVSGFGQRTPSLHELATLSGIPGKLGIAGDDWEGVQKCGSNFLSADAIAPCGITAGRGLLPTAASGSDRSLAHGHGVCHRISRLMGVSIYWLLALPGLTAKILDNSSLGQLEQNWCQVDF